MSGRILFRAGTIFARRVLNKWSRGSSIQMSGGPGRGPVEDAQTVVDAADEAYYTAFEMCGNNGQVSIIEMTTYDGFHHAAAEIMTDGMGDMVLYSYCPYPEAVGEILDEALQLMTDIIEEYKGEAEEWALEAEEEDWVDFDDF